MTNDLCVKVAIVTQSLVNYLSNILHSNPPFAQTPSPARKRISVFEERMRQHTKKPLEKQQRVFK